VVAKVKDSTQPTFTLGSIIVSIIDVTNITTSEMINVAIIMYTNVTVKNEFPPFLSYMPIPSQPFIFHYA
jgi:hypothetical protein